MNGAIDRRELFVKALAGLIGGAIGWIPVEFATHGQSLTDAQSGWTTLSGIATMAILAGMIGGMILAAEDNTLEISPATERRFLLGFLVCLVLAIPEGYYSDVIFTDFLIAGGWGMDHPGSVSYLIAGRLVSWSLMGLMLGIGVGLASASLRNTLRGGLGGLIGGFVGGACFDLIGSFSETGLASRLVGFCVIGFAIGFFIGLVHQLAKTAWLVVEAGRLKGRQFRLEGAVATLGRAEENSIGLFGDPAVQPRHAIIEHRGDIFALKNLAVQAGTRLNGNRIETTTLHEGDRISIGNYELSFHTRSERTSRESAVLGPIVKVPDAGVVTSVNPPPLEVSPAAIPATFSAAPRPYLVGAGGQRFDLPGGAPVRLGRALDNDIVVADASVSRHHASIEARNGSFVLRDLGSQNGTWIGERRITEAALGPGDLLRLGDAVFTFYG